MKFLRIGNPGNEIPALLDKDGKIRDLSKYVSDFDRKNLNFENLEKLQQLDFSKLNELDNNQRIGSCVSDPGNFFAIGLNYKEHAEETGAKAPDYPVVFNKSVHSIVGPNDNIIIPKNSKKLDNEVEIAMDIGKKDKGGQWVKGKSGDTFGPLGPYLVTKDEIENLNNLNLSLDVNGNRHQTGNTSLMIFNFNYLIAHLSSFITLMPGDIITTGTPPGVGLGMNPPKFLKDGDELFLKVDCLGEQKSKVVSEK